MDECYVHGNNIKYLRLPEEVIALVPEDTRTKGTEGRGRGGRSSGGRIMGRGRGGGRESEGHQAGRGRGDGTLSRVPYQHCTCYPFVTHYALFLVSYHI